MKNKSKIAMLACSLMLLNNLNFVFAETQEKILTTSEINKIVENKDNIYGSPNRYWNEETGEFIIPDGYTKIESFIINPQTHRGNTIYEKVKHIYVPDSVKIIEKGSFNDCYIETVRLPKDLKEISECLFALSCLKKITLPDNLEKISYMAFDSTQLEEIEVPDSVVEMEGSVFSQCLQLKKIKLPKNLKYIADEMFYTALQLKEINIPDGVVGIGKSAFVGAKISELKLPKNLTRIGDYAFWRCENLESLEMPGVTALGNYVFSNCEKLSRLVVSSEFFKSKEVSAKAFEASDLEWPTFPSFVRTSVKENSVDVFVTDGISGLNISEIKTQNKWIRSIQSLNQENNNTQNNSIPNTGLANTNNIIINILICLGVVSVLKLKTKN